MKCDGITEDVLEKVNYYLNIDMDNKETSSKEPQIEMARLCNYLLYNDRDLDMPNVSAFLKKADILLLDEMRGKFSVGRFNIKDVSDLNKKYGYAMGSKLMKIYVEKLEKQLGDGGCVYRISGDNFICIFNRDNFENTRRFLSYTEIETENDDIPVIEMRSRTGYVLDLDQIQTKEELLDEVNIAGGLARNDNYSSFLIYDNELKKNYESAKKVSKLFPEALKKEEFLVYYQPKINIKDNSLHGAEALCRWNYNGEMVYPGNFIPVLEQSYAICKLDFYMLEHVCDDIRDWLDKGIAVRPISINFSRLNLTEKNLAQHIVDIIDKYKIPRNLIEIELTETTTDGDIQAIRQLVLELGCCDVGTAIDDFGVGYSSLNLLRDMPWKVLKLDKCFLPTHEDSKYEEKMVVLRGMISMARDLGIECLSEGAETIEQVETVEKCGCDIIQGDYYYKPMDDCSYEELMINKNS